MFRSMRRFKQQVSEEECMRVLTECKRAALAVNGEEGYPYAVPINFYFDPDSRRIYFHGAKEGHKIDAMQKDDRVCFTAWDEGIRREGHWEFDVTSVIAFGRVKKVEDTEKIRLYAEKLCEKYYPNTEEITREMNSGALNRAILWGIEIEHMTGKLVNEK